MHAIKGGWVGQTLALAKCNDSGRRKSRIRHSKEERKTMVESFIKKYQKLNNGNFPSLNLTHKEVGGSFYTVREIVREIIQENRVLGPAKLTPEELHADSFFEQYPLGSISVEPQVHVVSSNGSHILTTHVVPNHCNQNLSATKVLEPSGQCQVPKNWRFHDGNIVNGSNQAAESKQETPLHRESPGRKALEREDVEKELVASDAKMTKITDVMVETFPLRSDREKKIENAKLEAVNYNHAWDRVDIVEISSSIVDDITDVDMKDRTSERNHDLLDERKQESSEQLPRESPVRIGLEGEEDEKEAVAFEVKIPHITADIVVETFPIKPGKEDTSNMKLEAINNNPVVDTVDVMETPIMVDDKVGDDVAGPVSEMNYALGNEKADPPLESLNHSTTEDSVGLRITEDTKDLEIKESLPVEMKPTSSLNGKENFNGTISSNSEGQPISEVALTNESVMRHGGGSEKASNSTLDRINLESWDATSGKSAGHENNSLLAFLKALIAAFVKFWSE